jgi:hypothetical protein
MHVRGFAVLTFPESAGLCLARAVERAFADPTVDHPEAWVIDERGIQLAFDGQLTRSGLEALKRLLSELMREASSAEAYLDVDGDRWDARAATSGIPRPEQSGPAEADPELSLPTIRTKIVG